MNIAVHSAHSSHFCVPSCQASSCYPPASSQALLSPPTLTSCDNSKPFKAARKLAVTELRLKEYTLTRLSSPWQAAASKPSLCICKMSSGPCLPCWRVTKRPYCHLCVQSFQHLLWTEIFIDEDHISLEFNIGQ